MPTYEFRCPDGHVFDRFGKMSDAVVEVPCPVCGKPATRQISGGSGLVFKGSGFYLTDYGKNAHRGDSANGTKQSGEGAASGGESKGGEAKPAESKSESKTEAKTESKSSEPKPAQTKGSGGGGSSSSSSDK